MSPLTQRSLRSPGWSRYLTLIFYKTYAELRAESERTYVGYVWWAIEPILSMGVYYLVFKWILDRGTENYAMFLIVGLVPWRWLSTGILHGGSSIGSAGSLMQQVYIPKLVFPLISILSDTFKFLVVFVLLLLFVVGAGFPVGMQYLALPLILFVQGALIAGITLCIAGIMPFLPDVRIVLENLVRLWLFLSGIFYPLTALPEALWPYFRLNPMALIVSSYREVLMYGRWPDFAALAWVGLVSLLLVIAGVNFVRHNDFRYAKLHG